VVALGEGQTDFVLVLVHFCDAELRVIALKFIGIDVVLLMSEEVVAIAQFLLEKISDNLFEELPIIGVDAVPYLGGSLMQ
jgi:hypothetical protein